MDKRSLQSVAVQLVKVVFKAFGLVFEISDLLVLRLLFDLVYLSKALGH